MRVRALISPRMKCAFPWFQSETALWTKKTNLIGRALRHAAAHPPMTVRGSATRILPAARPLPLVASRPPPKNPGGGEPAPKPRHDGRPRASAGRFLGRAQAI